MRFVPVNCIKEGMVVGRQLLGRNGELLLNSGTVIRSSFIGKILELGYNGIYIEDDLSKDIQITELISESLKLKTVKTIKDTFSSIEKAGDVSTEHFDDIGKLIDSIVEDILSNKDAMVNMVDLKVFDNYTFYHSVNVTVLSLVIGVTMGLDRDKLYKLGLAALLHDIGKVFIPKEILGKPGKLTNEEFEIMKSHPFKGYQYLKDKAKIPVASCIAILQHHERFDGTGYPLGLKGQKINLFGKIISIADIYDALTSDRPYRKAMIPSEAIEYIMGGGNSMFDPQVVSSFMRKIAPYPVGTCVCLSNNSVGLVIENYADCCMRPKIKIIKHGENEVDPYIIDLKNNKNTRHITITGVVDASPSLSIA